MDLKATLMSDNITLPDNFFYNIQKYKEHLFKWNKIHNLTGARDENTLNHFIYDAVFPVSFLPKYKNLLDIGTGAGFPGMILALALPDTQVTLAEPLTKRASFLQFIKADLGLDNVRVVKKRV
ncbi:MAG: 16S rRNA (guanine(527)-N(7))-methyltransferase RsmG, partial [Candidatus Cloacimonadota bacterium]